MIGSSFRQYPFHVNFQLLRELSEIFAYIHINMGSCDGLLLIVA